MTRLIDANKIEYTSIAHLASYPIAPSPCDTVMRAEINAMPTVDAEPVRHGKWLSREEGRLYPFWERYTCSECGKHADDTKYCPNCGAKMDAERKEE